MLGFKQYICEDADTETTLKKQGLRRGGAGYKVGKVIGGEVYVHKNYESQFPQDELSAAKAKLPKGFNYNTLKYNPKTKSFSFFRVDDFDTNPEPIIDEYVTVKPDSDNVKISKGGQIYHHKWQWVGDDYKGFDVAKNKVRSAKWSSLTDDDIGQSKFKSKIGKNEFWQKHVVEPHLKESGESYTASFTKQGFVEVKDGNGKLIKKGTPPEIHRYLKDNNITNIKFTKYDPFEEDD